MKYIFPLFTFLLVLNRIAAETTTTINNLSEWNSYFANLPTPNTIPGGCTLYFDGGIITNTLDIIVQNGGTFTNHGGIITNNGTITIQNGGTLFNDGGIITNNGTIYSCGSVLSNGGIIDINPVQIPPAMTICDDGNDATIDDVFDESCVCAGTPCTLGQYSDGSTCIPCELGTYADEEGLTGCKPCGVNMTTNGEGATSSDQCISTIPTLSQWSLIILGLCLSIFGLVTMKQRIVSTA